MHAALGDLGLKRLDLIHAVHTWGGCPPPQAPPGTYFPIFLKFARQRPTEGIAGWLSCSYSTMYHSVPPVVSQASKTAFHGTSPSPTNASGFVFENSLR